MLQRHADAPQTALDQLIMLQRCVDDAAATAAAAGELPDSSAWESCSGSEDEHAFGGGGVGASWAQDLTPEELAALEQGTFPPDLQQGQHQPAAAAPAGTLSQEEQLTALKAECGGMPDRDLAEALAACDGDLFAAAELLRSFAAEDAAAAAGASSAGLNGGALLGGEAGVAATVPAPAVLPSALPEPAGGPELPLHVGPKVQHLARRFPGAPTESLQVQQMPSLRVDALRAWAVGHAQCCPRIQHSPLLLCFRPLAGGAGRRQQRPCGSAAHAARQRLHRG